MHKHTHTHAENRILKNEKVLFEKIDENNIKKYDFFMFVANHTTMSLTILSFTIFANNIYCKKIKCVEGLFELWEYCSKHA